LTDHLPAELLLEFMYLAPVGIVSFRADGTIELMNPAAAQVLMPITQDADLLNLTGFCMAPCQTCRNGWHPIPRPSDRFMITCGSQSRTVGQCWR
jgi:hypothetical protein